MTREDVIGRSRDDIATLLKHAPRQSLYDLVHELATLEPHWTPEQVSRARRIGVRKVKQFVREGLLRAHRPQVNGYTIPHSAVLEFDQRTALQRRG